MLSQPAATDLKRHMRSAANLGQLGRMIVFGFLREAFDLLYEEGRESPRW